MSLRPRKEYQAAPSIRRKRYGSRSAGAYYRAPSVAPSAGRLPKCPKCGAQLNLRNGSFGMFIGCSGWPTCKYTRKVNSGTR